VVKETVVETVVVEAEPEVIEKEVEVVVTATPAPEQIDLEWLVPGLSGNVIWREPFQGAIDDFVADNPNVSITMTEMPWITDREVILTRLVSGEAPDLFYTHSNRVAEIGEAMQGFVQFEESFGDYFEVADWFPKARVDTCRSVDGHYYGLPSSTLIFATACNMAILEDVGITEPPTTWTEMRETALAVTIPGERWGVGWPMGAGIDTAYRLYPYALKAGSRFLSEDLTTAIWNDEASLETMQHFLDIQADGSFVPGTDAWTGVEEWNAWGQGVFAIAIGGPWIPLVTPEEMMPDMRLIKTPMPDGGPMGEFSSATLSDDIMMTITRQTPYKDICWGFLKVFKDAEHDKMWLDPAMGGQPVNKASYADQRWKEFWGSDIYEAESEVAVPWSYSTILGELHNEYTKSISQVWSGEKGLQEAFDEGVARSNDLLAKL
jgi:multiple sugar transport system substrate-binding protein